MKIGFHVSDDQPSVSRIVERQLDVGWFQIRGSLLFWRTRSRGVSLDQATDSSYCPLA
jgi:hypothetical protein